MKRASMLLSRSPSPSSTIDSWTDLEESDMNEENGEQGEDLDHDNEDADLEDDEDDDEDEENDYETSWNSFGSLAPKELLGESIFPSRYVYKPGPFLHYADDPFSETRYIDPFEFCMHAAARFTQIPFTRFTFNGTKSYMLSPPSSIKELQAPAKFDPEYFTPPFNGMFNSLFLAILRFRAVNFHSTLLTDIQAECNAVGEVGNNETFLRFPPSMSDKEPGSCLWDFRQHHTRAVTLIHSLHVLLILEQSAECTREDIEVMFADSNLCTPVTLHRGKFYQQLTPTANPFYSLTKAGYIHSACGILCFYGETDIARILDEILVMPYPNEDLVATLLTHYHLDNMVGTYIIPNFSLQQIYDIAKKTCNKQRRFYSGTRSFILMAPPGVAPLLLKHYKPSISTPLSIAGHA
ncbi:hypothetical protein V8E55_010334 [Tylopilus felleus]